MDSATDGDAMALAETLRDQLPELGVQLHCGGGSFKSRIKKADRSGARLALLIGETVEHPISTRGTDAQFGP